MNGIYIHIPFCKKKCNYCDFHSFAGQESLQEAYVNRLVQEIENYRGTAADTIYIGGGTPAVLSAGLLEKVVAACSVFAGDRPEFTVEANPGTLTEEKLDILLRCGVNRLSLGVQSFHDGELQVLGRIHSGQEAVDAFNMARRAGFSNINLDLMYGTPDQTMESWQQTLQQALDLGPEHISAYSMILEEHTPFWYMDLNFPDEEVERAMHWHAIEALQKHGYGHYEISNFAKPGYESRHNLKYWTMEPYLGLGCGAASFIDGERRQNVAGIEAYIAAENPVAAREPVDDETFQKERMMLGFRLIDGVEAPAKFDDIIEELIEDGLIEHTGGKVRLTSRGLDLANRVFMEFV